MMRLAHRRIGILRLVSSRYRLARDFDFSRSGRGLRAGRVVPNA